MNRKYERPEVKQITRQWVKDNSHAITERDIGLLKLLQEKRLLRRDQIQTLYPEFPSTDYLNKRLSILFKRHFIDKIYPPVGLGEGSSKQHICLDRAGIVYLELENYNKPIRTSTEGERSLPSGWRHVIAINEYECKLRDHLKGIGAEIKMWETEDPCHFGDTKLIPDIFVLIAHKGKGYPLFIEVDLGTEDLPFIKKKCDTYARYYTSKSWLTKKWARVFKTPTFPRVLLLTENNRTKRVGAISDYTRKLGVKFFVEEHQYFANLMKFIIKE